MSGKRTQALKQRRKGRRSAGGAGGDADDREDEQRNMVGMRVTHVDGESDSLFAFDPLTALIVASVFIAGVVVMHILSKFTR